LLETLQNSNFVLSQLYPVGSTDLVPVVLSPSVEPAPRW
jgi:hypothetical protein